MIAQILPRRVASESSGAFITTLERLHARAFQHGRIDASAFFGFVYEDDSNVTSPNIPTLDVWRGVVIAIKPRTREVWWMYQDAALIIVKRNRDDDGVTVRINFNAIKRIENDGDRAYFETIAYYAVIQYFLGHYNGTDVFLLSGWDDEINDVLVTRVSTRIVSRKEIDTSLISVNANFDELRHYYSDVFDIDKFVRVNKLI